MKKIVVLALDGVMDSSLAITLDTLRTAEAFRVRSGKTPRLDVLVAGHRREIRTGGGMRLRADLTFADVPERAEWLIVPGAGLTSDDAIVKRLRDKDVLAAMEVIRATRARRIGASCSSVFVLAEAGVLAGREVTTTWWLAQTFRERYGDVRLEEAHMLVRDGRFVTAGSAFAQLDLALAVVTDTMGAKIAQLCSRYLLIDQRPSQARYMIQSHVRSVDPAVVAAERWIDANLAGPIAVTELAAALAMSARTLARRIAAATGLSPIRFVQRRRVLQAANLIETTSMTVEEVAERVGYGDATALRKVVKRELGITPAALRIR